MSRNSFPDTWDAEGHPPLEVLRQYQSGELALSQTHRIEQHLLSCELCSDLVGGMALAQPARVRTAVRETRGRLKYLLAQKKRKRKVFQLPFWQMTAVLLVLLFALGEVVYHHYFALGSHNTSPAAAPTTSWVAKGRVVNQEGQALMGAIVKIKDTMSSGDTTDVNGEFIIDVPNKEATLVVRHPNYPNQETISIMQSEDPLEVVLTKTD